jgi:segregation and condensation protein A
MTYRVDLDSYNGPMDLLLYLIRKEEVEITDIPIVRIAEQYMQYLGLLQSMDINIAGEFIVMAATLMEIKSRMILPRPEMPAEEGEEGEDEDPRLELVRQLLEYKRFREAAQDLEGLGDEQLRRFSRPAAEVVIGPEEQRQALDEMLKDVEIWDLLNAFARIMKSINIAPREVIYDDTPIEQVAEQLLMIMGERKTALFSDLITTLFAGQEQIGRTHLVGAFLAILECIRQRYLSIAQDREFADLRLFWRDDRDEVIRAVEQGAKAPPPVTGVTSREEARQSEGFERARGRFKDELSNDDAQKTEFDDLLESIKVPDVAVYKPIYSDDELMGRKDSTATQGTAPAEGPEAPAPPATEPATPATPDAEPPAPPPDQEHKDEV